MSNLAQKVWKFYTVAGTPEAEKTWGKASWRMGGGGWMPGTYDAETNTVWWSTANPALDRTPFRPDRRLKH